jgi:hypothetical protein
MKKHKKNIPKDKDKLNTKDKFEIAAIIGGLILVVKEIVQFILDLIKERVFK